MPVKEEPQISMTDQVVDAPEVLKLLDKRKKAAAGRNLDAERAFKDADKAAKDAIKALEVGGEIRIGQWWIKVSKIEPQDISFETHGGARVSIKETEAEKK